ncbi:hypothetical protein ACLOJK_038378 [Asimina triloba]
MEGCGAAAIADLHLFTADHQGCCHHRLPSISGVISSSLGGADQIRSSVCLVVAAGVRQFAAIVASVVLLVLGRLSPLFPAYSYRYWEAPLQGVIIFFPLSGVYCCRLLPLPASKVRLSPTEVAAAIEA